ncbi:hypothetical protein BGX27_001158 [Mortierella sp. AM989]|nr:hypothetical protein BGX27_001158 [Mortierella sp. AM989]
MLQPDTVLFLGDLLDGGRETMSAKQFEKNKIRLMEKVFDLNRTAWNPEPIVMGTEDMVQETRGIQKRSRYDGYKTHGIDGNDSSSMLDEMRYDVHSDLHIQEQSGESQDSDVNIAGHFQQIISVPSDSADSLVVLDTLALSSNTASIREESQKFLTHFGQGGAQYQNMVNTSLTREILRKIRPDMVFSGDDHDWCEIAHPLDNDKLSRSDGTYI